MSAGGHTLFEHRLGKPLEAKLKELTSRPPLAACFTSTLAECILQIPSWYGEELFFLIAKE